MEAKVKRPTITISAVITRKDGTIEDLGVICGKEMAKIYEKRLEIKEMELKQMKEYYWNDPKYIQKKLELKKIEEDNKNG